jgi:hypothetical protein
MKIAVRRVAHLVVSEVGFFGPFGQYITGIVLVGLSLAIVSGFTVLGALAHDQGAYASVISGAANSAARNVDVQALAGGAVEVDTAKAPTVFDDYLTTQGGLTQSGQGTYAPGAVASGQTAGQTPTVTGLSVSQSASSTGVSAQGWVWDAVPLPVLGDMTVRLPVNVTVEPQVEPADRI